MYLTIESLAEIIGGRLRMADLPPLGGMWEPLGRILTRNEDIAPGDVLFVLPELLQLNPCCVHEAFDRGALGIVHAGKAVEPWAGRFSIGVDDVSLTLTHLARWLRSDFNGRVVAVAGSVGKTLTCALIDAVLSPAALSPWQNSCQINETLCEQMIRWETDQQYGIAEIQTAGGDSLHVA